MPNLDGIGVYMISQYEAGVVPEYAPSTSADPFLENVKLYDHEKRTVSVYVPVYRRSQFWFAYQAFPKEAETPFVRYFYFKLFINGRFVVSWGVGQDDAWSGKTMWSLYSGWRLEGPRDQKVVVPCTEHRTFRWGKAEVEDEIEPKQDVIEIKVFRARARKQIPLELHRHADTLAADLDLTGSPTDKTARAGMTNSGPLMYGQPKNYYKYALMDPVDTPYITFRYIYRTLSQLQRLGVIASDELERQEEEAAAEDEADLGAQETPRAKSRLIPSISLRSIVSAAGNIVDVEKVSRLPMHSNSLSSSPLRIPQMSSIATQDFSTLNLSADDLSNVRDSLSDDDDQEISPQPSSLVPSVYVSENSPLMNESEDGFHTHNASMQEHTFVPNLGNIPFLRHRRSQEQSLRDCIHTLLEQPAVHPETPAPLDSPTPGQRRKGLAILSRRSNESLRGSSPATLLRGESKLASDAGPLSRLGNSWINDLFTHAKDRAEHRAKAAQGQESPIKQPSDARDAHQESMTALNGLVHSAEKRHLRRQTKTNGAST